MTEQTNTPELRFPEFKKEWKEYQFQTHLSKIETGTNKLGSEDFLGLPLLKMGNIQRGNFSFNKLEKLKKDEVVNKEHLIQNKDFLFNTRNTMELVGKSATWRGESNKFAFNSNIARLTLENMDTVFFNYLYNTPKLIHKVKSLAVGTTSVAAIYPRDLKKLKYFIPIFDEQLKIGEFFSKLDRQIELEEEKLELLEQQKKGYIQKIFSQELRFKDENGNNYPNWEMKKLGNIANIVGGGTPSTKKSEYWDGDINWFSPVEIGDKEFVSTSQRRITEKGLEKSSAKVLPIGTVLFTSRAGIGKTAILSKEATTNQGFQSIVPKENDLDSYFLYSMTSILKRNAEKVGAGSTFSEVSRKQMEQIKLLIPILKEQKQIGRLFQIINRKINKQIHKIELLKQRKKGLLQKMFV